MEYEVIRTFFKTSKLGKNFSTYGLQHQVIGKYGSIEEANKAVIKEKEIELKSFGKPHIVEGSDEDYYEHDPLWIQSSVDAEGMGLIVFNSIYTIERKTENDIEPNDDVRVRFEKDIAIAKDLIKNEFLLDFVKDNREIMRGINLYIDEYFNERK